jgi:hypothetical protein
MNRTDRADLPFGVEQITGVATKGRVYLRGAASKPVVAAKAFPVVTKKGYLCPG